jgi:hypothetical protein
MTQLLDILGIAHDTSSQGAGLSLRDALQRAGYAAARRDFGASDLVPLLRANPELVQQWFLYCVSKRTDGGWWVKEDSLEVGCLASPQSTIRCASLEDAVAEFVVRELDFWSARNR